MTSSLTSTHVPAAPSLIAHFQGKGAEMFYLQADHHVHELWRWSACANGPPFDGWHSVDVNRQVDNSPEVAANSSLSNFFNPANNTDAVFYVDIAGHMREFFYSKELVWTNVDVTAISGAPTVEGGDFVSQLNPKSSVSSVYFLDGNRNIRVVTSPPSNPTRWTEPFAGPVNLLTGKCDGSAAPAPPALLNSPLVADVNLLLHASEDINYQGADSHLYQLKLLDGVWYCTDVTKLSSAPIPAP
jgi:hypothetical protein